MPVLKCVFLCTHAEMHIDGLEHCVTINVYKQIFDLLQANLHGVLPVHKAAFGPLQQSALRWSNRLKQMFAVCHSLNMVSKSVAAGTSMERSLFKAVEACFLVCTWLCVHFYPPTLAY